MAEAITPELLWQWLGREHVRIVDTRDPGSFDEWHIPGAINVPYKPGEEPDLGAIDSIDLESDERLVTICAKGISSYAFADELAAAGYEDVHVVQDGMRGWSRVYAVASVPTAATSLEIFQLQRIAKGCIGYVIAAPHASEAVVVDPTRHTDEYRRIATDDGMDITHVIDTHVHADHVSGGRTLAEETGATYHLPAAAGDRVSFDFTPLERNEVLTIGDVDMKAIHTPGHTAEAMCIVVGADAVLTGDTVFVDGVGRTELQFGDAGAERGAESLYESIHGSILTLPDGLSVLPGHVSIEDADRLTSLGNPVHTTIEQLRTSVPVLNRNPEGFVDQVARPESEKPPHYERMIAINAGEEGTTDEDELVDLELGPNRCAAEAD